MRAAALTGTQRWPIGSESVLPLAGSLTLSRQVGTWALKDGFASFGHSATSWSRAWLRRRRWRRRVDRTRSGLRNNQSPRCRRWSMRWLSSSCSNGGGRRGSFAACRFTGSCRWDWGLHRRDRNFRRRCFGYRLDRILHPLLDRMFNRRGCLLGRCGGRSFCRLGWNGDRGRWTRHRLRCDEAWRRLGRLDRSNRCRTSSGSRRLGHTAGRTRRNRRGRRHRLPWRSRRSCGSGWMRSHFGLVGLLRDRFQHVSGLGDVRQVDLGLELLRLCTRTSAGRAAAVLAVLSEVLFDALRLIHFDGAGVRLLLRDSDLHQQIENHFALDLKLPGQIVNSNLLMHSALFPPFCPICLRAHGILTLSFVDP